MSKPKFDFPEVRASSKFVTVGQHIFREAPRSVVGRSYASAGAAQRPVGVKKARLSLDDLLAGYDPEKHGGELMAFEPVGREKL